jgi:hypothetical protein
LRIDGQRTQQHHNKQTSPQGFSHSFLLNF